MCVCVCVCVYSIYISSCLYVKLVQGCLCLSYLLFTHPRPLYITLLHPLPIAVGVGVGAGVGAVEAADVKQARQKKAADVKQARQPAGVARPFAPVLFAPLCSSWVMQRLESLWRAMQRLWCSCSCAVGAWSCAKLIASGGGLRACARLVASPRLVAPPPLLARLGLWLLLARVAASCRVAASGVGSPPASSAGCPPTLMHQSTIIIYHDAKRWG